MMDSIAALSMNMKAAEFQQSYSIALMKEVMETSEQAALNSIEMIAEASAPIPAKGQYIDVYA